MIIKTIWTKDPEEFDNMVNEAMQEICDFNPLNKWPPVHPEGASA